VRDPSWIISNLKERTFETHVGRHIADWKPAAPVTSPPPVAAAPAPSAAEQTAAAAAPRTNVNFPSAASIPPVSIMNNEPGATGQNGMDPPKPDATVDQKAPLPRANTKKSERRSQPAGAPEPSTSPASTGAAGRVQ
jgi:hypothetical protein